MATLQAKSVTAVDVDTLNSVVEMATKPSWNHKINIHRDNTRFSTVLLWLS